MIIGGEKIEDVVTRTLDNIAMDNNADELAEVDEVMIVVVVHRGSSEDMQGEIGQLFYSCSSARYHVQLGLVAQLARAVDSNLTPHV
jgi:hypothetical protein